MHHFVKTVLVVGLGSIGRRHVGIIKNLFPEINIVVLRHKQCDKNDIDKLGLYKCVTSIDEAVATNPQAAIIANPAPMHIEVAKKLAKKGINLLIEKPISDSPKGIQGLIDTCSQNNCILMAAYNLRFLPSLIEFKTQLRANKIGNIYSIRSEIGQYLPSWRPESDYKNGVSANKHLGGGVLLELSHEIDYLRWIFGPIDWVKSHISKQSDLDVDVEDTAHIIFGFKNNSTLKRTHNLVAQLNMDFIRHDSIRKCIVICENGTLQWDGITNTVSFYPKDGKKWEVIFSERVERNYTYREEIKHFFNCIESSKAPLVSGVDGANVLRIINAIRESGTT